MLQKRRYGFAPPRATKTSIMTAINGGPARETDETVDA
jgi:hypothetical protein